MTTHVWLTRTHKRRIHSILLMAMLWSLLAGVINPVTPVSAQTTPIPSPTPETSVSEPSTQPQAPEALPITEVNPEGLVFQSEAPPLEAPQSIRPTLSTRLPADVIACATSPARLFIPWIARPQSTVSIENNVPVASPCHIWLDDDVVTATLDLTSMVHDTDGDPMTFSVPNQPHHGTATIVGNALTYTPTQKLTDTLLYRADDGRGGIGSGTIQIYWNQSNNRPPVAEDLLITIKPTETVALDLSGYVSDPDGDSIGLTLATTPTHGIATLIDTTINYSPTSSFTERDRLAYRVTDAHGAAAEAEVEFSIKPTRIHLTPGSVMLTQQGQSRQLTARAYDANGKEVPTADLGLEWALSDSSAVSMTIDSANPAQATITSLVPTGSAILTVRSTTDPDIPTTIATVLIATVRPGVVVLPDDHAVFPEPNPLPNQPALSFPLDPLGEPIIGSFSMDEVIDQIGATGSYSDSIPVTSVRYPVVIRGQAPVPGTLVLVGESSPIFGRVLHSIQRGEFSLVQLERVTIPTMFSKIKFSVNAQSLISSGFLEKEAFIPEADQHIKPSQANRSASTDRCERSGSGNPPTVGFASSLDYGPVLEMDLDYDEELIFFRGIVGVEAELSLEAEASIQAGGTYEFECNLAEPKKFELPSRTGWFAIINLALGPRILVTPKFIASFSVSGGPKLGLGGTFTLSAEANIGYVWQNGQGTPIKVFDHEGKFEFDTDGIDNINESLAAQVDFTAGLYLVAEGKFIAGGLIFDAIEEIGDWLPDSWEDEWEDEVEDFREDLSFEVLELQAGPQFSLTWANVYQVLNEEDTPSNAAFEFVATAGPSDIAEVLEIFDLKIPVEITLIEHTAPLVKLYEPLEEGFNEIKPSPVAKVGDTVTFEITPNGEGLEGGAIYYDGELIKELTLNGMMLTGDWQVTQDICDASNASDDGFATLDIIGYNRMTNQSAVFIPIYVPAMPVLKTPNYLGSLGISCGDLRIEVEVTANGKPYDGGPIIKCTDENGNGSLPIAMNAIAEDDQGLIHEITIDSVGPQKVFTNGPDNADTKIEVPHEITLTPNDPSTFEIKARVTALDGNDEPNREKETTLEVEIEWKEGCNEEVEEPESRFRSERCFTIEEQRIRTGTKTIDPETGETETEWGPWGPWNEVGRTPTGICTRPARAGGDPHILTQDGLEFDSFSLGEFIYLKPRPGHSGITVQARQERVPNMNGQISFPWTSWNTALAFKAEGTIVELRAGSLTTPVIDGQPTPLLPGLHSFGVIDIKVNSASVVEVSYNDNRFIVNEVMNFLELRATVVQNNSLHGMLGTPNGDIGDDFRWPDGTPATDAFDLANGWRITERTQSLFTYATGVGPETYNQVQLNEPPSREELAPFVEQARQLLQATCVADVLDEVAVYNAALELYTGRNGTELAQSGVCWFLVRGTVTNSFVDGLPVPGAKVTITSPNLEPCVTYTDRKGVYACYMPSLGQIPDVTVTLSERGQATTTIGFNALPPMNGINALEQNLEVTPTTLEMTGFVRDGNGSPLYNAELRIKGPQNDGFDKTYAKTNGDGQYTTYLMVDDDVTSGNTTYQLTYNPQWNTEPTAKSINVSLQRPLPALQIQGLNQISETLVLTGNIVDFSGRVSYAFDVSKPAVGVRVFIEPTTPIAGWTGCDVVTKALVKHVSDPATQTNDPAKEGTYSCELPLSQTGPFDVRIWADGHPEQLVQVDPGGRGVGEIIAVVKNLTISTTVVHVSGMVQNPAGGPVSGATVVITGPSHQLLSRPVVVQSGIDGRYSAYVGIRTGVTSGNLGVEVRYKDIKSFTTVPFGPVRGGFYYEIPRDITIDGRWLRFQGRVINHYSPNTPLKGVVTISSPGLGTLCSGSLDITSSYTCTGRLNFSSQQPLVLNYAVSGTWGSASDSMTLTNLPNLGEIQAVIKEISAEPTTLRLQGRIITPAGQPLVGATVSVAGPGFGEGKTSNDGTYLIHMPISTATTSGTLDYSVSFRTSSVTATQAFTAAPNQVTTIAKDISYGYRLVYFRGQARNDYGIQMPFSTVSIFSSSIDQPCTTQTNADGTYFCAAQTNATAPFSVTYAVEGNWGQNSFTEQVEVPLNQDRIEHIADLRLNPTALHLVGTLTDPSGAPLNGVELTVSGASVYQESRGKTDANGNYDFYVILKTQPASPFNGLLTYRVGYGTATIVRDVRFVGANNTLSELYQNFTLNARVIQFSGTVVNALVGGQAVNGSRVSISSPTLGKLCEYSLLNREHLSTYACDAMVFSDQPFAIEYLVDGGWGTTLLSGTVSTIPPLGQRVSVTRNLPVNPTTMHLAGRVVDRDGQPIPSANVHITGAGLYQPIAVKTDIQGNYAGYGVLKSGITTSTLEYEVEVNNDSPLRRSIAVIATANALHTHTEDFYFPSRKFTLTGALINQTDRSLLLSGKLTIVSPSLDQTLCVTTIAQGAYQCTVLVYTDQAITLNYRVEGAWGTVTLLNQVAPGGAKTFAANLSATPRVLHLTGTVHNPNATPLANVWITISSYTIVNGQLIAMRNRTDANGDYYNAVVVGDGTLNGDLRYDIEQNGNTAHSLAGFAFSGNTKLLTVSHDITMTSRMIHFTGNLDNTLLASQGSWSRTRITVSSPTLGKLCETYSQGSYSCSAKINTDQPFDVVYTAHGDWGSASANGYIATLPPVGGQSTFRRDINATPTMLRVVGTTQESNGTPKAGVQIMPAIPAPYVSSVWQNSASNAQGTYELIVVLKQISETTTGTLRLQASYGPTHLTQEVPFDAQVGALTTVNAAHFEFNARTIILTGRLINTLAPNVPAAQPKGSIRVLDPNREQYCQSYSSSYTCPVTVYSEQPLEVIIDVQAEWGSAEQRVLVSDIPESGGSTSVTTNIEAAPTTVHLLGKVVNPNGQPLANATIEARLSSQQPPIAIGTTDGVGQYSLYALLDSGATNVSLSYKITYDGIVSTFIFRQVTVAANQLYARHEDFTFEKRRVRFTGSVMNQFVPNLPVPAHVTITSPDFFTERYCDAAVDEQGTYACDAFIRSSEPFSVNYRLTGGWGTLDIPGSVTSIPDVGGSVVVEKSLQAAPTTLHLSGMVTDGYGKKLANAEIRIGGTGAVRGVTARTDAHGNYTTHLMLNNNVTSGDLTYQIVYYQATLSQNRHFMGLQENQRTEFPQDFEVAIRELTFTGRVRQQANPSLGLRGKVTISSPAIGVICSVNTSANGDYTCPKTAITTEAFSATYAVDGDWGQHQVVHPVPFGVVGSTATISQILEAQPTMLRLSGQLRDQHGAPLANVRLTVSSPALSHYAGTPVMITNAQGEYSLDVLIKAAMLDETLTYQIDFNQVRGAVQVPFTALPNQTTQVVKDITFTSRAITFNGKIVNGHHPAVAVPYAKVEISSAILGDLCVVTTNAAGNYSCTLQVLNDEPFAVKYAVSGTWGSATATGLVDSGGAGTTTIVSKDISVTPTTLRLQGTITDSNGQPMSNAQVRVSGNSLVWEPTATTTGDGTYDLYVLVKEGIDHETLKYEVTYNTTTVTNQPFHRFTRGGLTTIPRDFTFAIRGFSFSGQVINAFAPTNPVQGSYATSVKVIAPGLGTLCQTNTGYYSPSYSCSAQLNVTQPFSLEYHLSGDWGTSIITKSITSLPPIGNTQNVQQGLEINPTTLRIHGTIRDAAGNPLPNARLTIANTSPASQINPAPLQATTSVSGTYEMIVILRADTAVGNLGYTINYANAQQAKTFAFVATPQQLSALQRDFTFTERSVDFSVTIANSFVPTHTLGARQLVIAIPQQAPLCNYSYGTHYSNYNCTTSITTTDAVSVTYRMSGDWGTGIYTGTIPAGVIGSSVEVNQHALVTPTTLHITGKVADSSGAGLANATVQVQGSMISAGNLNASVQTDANGIYHLYLSIKSGVTGGTLNFTASFNGVQTTASNSVSVTPKLLNEATQDFTISQRRVTFSGKIVNTFVPTKTVGSTKVVVTAEGIGKLCENTAGSGSVNYSCSTQITTTNALSLTYTITGDWGSSVVTGTAPAGGVGSASTIAKDLAVSPTTLYLTGKVTKPDGLPLANATVRVDSPQLSAHTSNGTVSTDATGTYRIYVILKAGVVSGPLNYTVHYQNGDLKPTLPFTATANQLTTITQDFTFTARSIQFSGSIVNALVAWTSYVPSTKVVISAPTVGTLCEYTYYTYTFNDYACTGHITTTNPLSVTYAITGPWGEAVITDTANGGSVGSSTSMVKNLAVAPTTLHLTGLTLGGGAPLAGTSLTVSSNAQIANQSVNSAADGGYEMIIVLKKNITSGTLQYQVRKGTITRNENHAFTASPNQLTAIQRTFDLNGRQLRFSGSIVNALLPTTTVGIKRVEVAQVGGNFLCSYSTSSASSYTCTAMMTHTTSLDVRYTVSGLWGTSIFTHTVPAGAIGDSTTINRTLAVTPTTIHLSGKVTRPDGSVLANAQVRVDSPDLNSGTFSTQTDATGTYHLYPVVVQDRSTPTLTYTIRHSSAEMFVSQVMTGTPNQLTHYAKDFQFNVRKLTLSGDVLNALASERVYVDSNQIIVTAPHLGVLCENSENYLIDYYWCSTPITDTAAFSVTYTVTGPWGTESFSGTVGAGAVGSSISVDYDLMVRPTTILLQGVVTGDPAPIQWARIYADSPALMYSGYRSTDQQGRYALYLILKHDGLSGTLDYRAEHGNLIRRDTIPFDAEPNQLTTITRNERFTERTLTFSGAIRNAFAPNQSLSATSVEVRSAAGTLCEWASATPSSSYSCTRTITNSQPLSLTYMVSGDWGSSVITGPVVTSFPNVGSSATINYQVNVSATTLHIHGRVTDPNGVPLPYASVYLDAPTLFGANWIYASTDANGMYNAYGVVRSTIITGSLTQHVYYGTSSMSFESETVTITAPKQLQSLERNLVFNSRRVVFQGPVTNALVPDAPVYAEHILISSPGLGTLCSVSGRPNQNFTYACTANVQTTEAFTVEYAVSGGWGTVLLTDTVAAGGINTTLQFPKTIVVTPTTLRVSGTLTLPDGEPLANASLRLGGPDVLYPLTAQTTSQGTYTIDLPINDVVTGTIQAQITYHFGVMPATIPFSAAVGAITELSFDHGFTARRIAFSTSFANAFVPSMTVAATSVTILGEDRIYCSDSWPYEIVSYGCTTQVFNSDPLSITYRVETIWGTSVVTGTVINDIPAIGESASVNRQLQLPLTTLHVTGTVRDLEGNPVEDAWVTLGENSAYEGSGYTNSQGLYSFYTIAHNDTVSDTLEYEVYYQDDLAAQQSSGLYSFTQGQMNRLTHDFIISTEGGGNDSFAVNRRQVHHD